MEYAKRISELPPYLFAEIDKKIAEKKAQGVDVINLGIGDPDLPTPSNIVEKLSEAAKNPQNHRYPSYVGMLSFREAAARWYKKRFKVTLDPEDEVITLIGSKEGIGHTPLAFINQGDLALVPDPGYPVYKVSVIFAGGKPVQMPLLEENSFKPDLSAIAGEVARKTRLMFLNYPNNPTAAVADKKFFKEVVDFAEDNDIIVCHDAPYSEITFDGYVSPSFLETPGAKEVGVEFHSLSKTYNMTGWRIGFAVGNPDVIAGVGKIKENVDSGVFQAIQYAGIEALEGPQDEVGGNIKILKDRRDLMVEGLSGLGWEVQKPKATFYLWIRCPAGMSSIGLSGMLLDKAGVVVTPGVGFGEYGEGYIRIALTQSKDRLQDALERIGEIGLPEQ